MAQAPPAPGFDAQQARGAADAAAAEDAAPATPLDYGDVFVKLDGQELDMALNGAADSIEREVMEQLGVRPAHLRRLKALSAKAHGLFSRWTHVIARSTHFDLASFTTVAEFTRLSQAFERACVDIQRNRKCKGKIINVDFIVFVLSTTLMKRFTLHPHLRKLNCKEWKSDVIDEVVALWPQEARTGGLRSRVNELVTAILQPIVGPHAITARRRARPVAVATPDAQEQRAQPPAEPRTAPAVVPPADDPTQRAADEFDGFMQVLNKRYDDEL